jgi:hypothetical protein
VLKILFLLAMTLIAGCASAPIYTPPQTVDGLRNLYTQFNRISAISHNIFVANNTTCSRLKTDYGFISMTVKEQGDEEQNKLWIKAFNLQKQPTVTYVTPGSAADRAGLLTGDAIISVNDSRWSDAETHDAFNKLLSEAKQSPGLRLGILRDNSEQTLNLSADKACGYSFILNISDKHRASASNRNIVVDLGAAKMLKRDEELAYFIAHELAHILLGHNLPERAKELDDYKMRNSIEKDADALGIRLMTRAGYDSKGAETALKSTDLLDSGPITRFFNYHGPYMPVDDRIQYLRKVLNE